MRRAQKLLHAGLGRLSHDPVSTNPVVFMDIVVEGDPAGRVSIELFHDAVPQAAENFRSLCTGERGVAKAPLTYKGVPFHRIIPGFVVQGGDIVTRDGRGSESIFGYLFPNDGNAMRKYGKVREHLPGTVAMVCQGPLGNGSQFFFNMQRSSHLDGKMMVVGQIVDGWDVVSAIAKSSGSRCGTPVSRAWINDCGQSGGFRVENTELLRDTERETSHMLPSREVLDVLRPRF